MPYESFSDLEVHLAELFQNKQFEDALETAVREGSKFSEERAWVDYWHMCAAARLKNYPLVIQIAENAFAKDVVW